MAERLILHIGSTKTGTSAIQSALARNRDLLRTHGVYFPEGVRDDKALAGRVTGGNGQIFRRFRLDYDDVPKWALEDFEDELQRIVVGTVLFSSEALGDLHAEPLADLNAVFVRHFRTVQVIYYVRHVADHAASQYGEYVKRRGMKDTFERFAERSYRAKFKQTIDTYESVFGRAAMNYVLYDDVRGDLYRDFLSRLGIPSDGHVEPDTVNRSLAYDELEVFRAINQLGIGKAFTARVAENYAFYNRPPTQTALPVSQRAVEAIGANNSDVIECVNARLGDGRLRVASEAIGARACTSTQAGELDTINPLIVLRVLESSRRVAEELGTRRGRIGPRRRRRLEEHGVAAAAMTQQADERFEPLLARAHALASMPQPAASEVLDVLERGVRLAEERRLAVRGHAPKPSDSRD